MAGLLLNVLDEVIGIHLGVVVRDNLAVAVNNELGEVPRDLLGLLLLGIVELGVVSEELVNGAGILSVDINLREQWELNPI